MPKLLHKNKTAESKFLKRFFVDQITGTAGPFNANKVEKTTDSAVVALWPRTSC